MNTGSLGERCRRLVASEGVVEKRAAHSGSMPESFSVPADLAALALVADGLVLRDGTRVLGLDAIEPATRWLVEEKSLDWDREILVVGERDDLVILRDVDASRKRAGGGILEVATDDLHAVRRVALNLVSYLEMRLGLGPDPNPAPEELCRKAIEQKDAFALNKALAEPFYPGSERVQAQAFLALGELYAASGDDVGAMRAFVRSVGLRVACAPKGSEASERAAGFRAAARIADGVGASALAESCLARAEV